MWLEFGVYRLRKAGLLEADDFCAFDVKMLFEVGGTVMLNDGIMGKGRADFGKAVIGDVGSDQDEMETAFAAGEQIASDD